VSFGPGPESAGLDPLPAGHGGSAGLRLRRSQRRAVSWRALLVAAVSTVVFFGGLVMIITGAPGWPEVERSFLNARFFWGSLPDVVRHFEVNVRLFLIAEVFILIVGLVLAVCRSLPGPVLFPVRLLATVYVDLFRAVPGILVIYLLALGIPGLGLAGVPIDPFIWAIVALTLLYAAYVSEVYRAGIESVHPSQEAAARSLGLSRLQALRYVILPQAIRRVIPPLLNDFIGLQKDTVLVSFVGVVDLFRAAGIKEESTFNFSPYLAVALVFVVVTFPLARVVDWLVARDRARAASGAR
jgi:polar amino acid transport system permease protein